MIVKYLIATFCIITFFLINYLLSIMIRWEIFLKEEYVDTIYQKVLIGIISIAITSSIYVIFVNLFL